MILASDTRRIGNNPLGVLHDSEQDTALTKLCH